MKNNDKINLTLDYLRQKAAYEGSKSLTVKSELAAPIVGVSPRTIRNHLHRLSVEDRIDLYVVAGRPFQVEVLS